MLHSFAFRNFCSFEDETTLSFVVGKQAPETDAFVAAAHGRRLSKVMAVLGANASGKTNTLKAFAFLSWFAHSSFRGVKPDEAIPFEQFAFTKKPLSASEFVAKFETDGVLYRYRVRLDTKRVLQESFEWQPPEKVKFSYLLKRTLTSKKEDTYDVRTQQLGVPEAFITGLARPNCSLVSALLHTGHGKMPHIARLEREFKQVIGNVNFGGRQQDMDPLGMKLGQVLSSDEVLTREVGSALASYDLGLASLKVGKVRLERSEMAEPETVPVPQTVHRVDGIEYSRFLWLESSGTRNLCRLLANCLPILRDGGIAVLDEFEADLHPLMVPELVNLFLNPGTNPGNAQLLFSCHSTPVLQELDKTQVYLIEKDERCRSHGWRLDEMQGVRRDDNLYAKYMAGAYGAVPNL